MDNETTVSRSSGKSNFLPVSILLAAVLISGSIIYSNGKKAAPGPQQPGVPEKADVSADDDAVLGSKSAKLTLIEFSDYQCPFCRKFWKEALASIKKDYIDTGKVNFVYRDWPLSGHPMAVPSAQASECAKEQGKFWEMHDKMFMEQDKQGQGTINYTVDDLKKWAKEIGLDATKFNQCLDSSKYLEEVQKDFNDGLAAGVDGTPVTFINGRAIVGAQPYAVFKAIIDSELAKK